MHLVYIYQGIDRDFCWGLFKHKVHYWKRKTHPVKKHRYSGKICMFLSKLLKRFLCKLNEDKNIIKTSLLCLLELIFADFRNTCIMCSNLVKRHSSPEQNKWICPFKTMVRHACVIIYIHAQKLFFQILSLNYYFNNKLWRNVNKNVAYQNLKVNVGY